MHADQLGWGSRILIPLVFSVVSLAGCVGDANSSRAPLAASKPNPATIALLRAAESPPKVTAAEFNRRNPYGWVGRAHNRFLRDFFLEINSRPTANVCAALKRVALEGRYLKEDANKVSRRDREQLYGPSTRGSRCSMRLAHADAAPRLVPASLGRRNLPWVPRDDPSSYFDAINAAMDNSATANALATAVSAIVSSAEANISGDALDGVYAVADVAVSSTDYWESSVQSELAAFTVTYGDCIHNSSDLSPCLYAMGYERKSPGAATFRIVNASYTPASFRRCGVSGRSIAKADVTGAVGGFFATFTPQGALLGAIGTSGGDAVWQFGSFLWCAYHQ